MAQEQTEKLMQPLKDGRIRPNEDVTVFSTEKLKSVGYPKVGTPIVVHRVQAEKMIASGKATESPMAEGLKEASKTPGKTSKATTDEDASL